MRMHRWASRARPSSSASLAQAYITNQRWMSKISVPCCNWQDLYRLSILWIKKNKIRTCPTPWHSCEPKTDSAFDAPHGTGGHLSQEIQGIKRSEWRTVKYENVFLKSYRNLEEAQNGLVEYFRFYNEKRPHQSLGYHTLAELYHSKN